jgi:hypothetical protein
MSKGAHDISALVMNLKANWQLKHVILGLFEDSETTRYTLVENLIDLLDVYGLRNFFWLMSRMKDLILKL